MANTSENILVLNLSRTTSEPAYPKVSKDIRGWVKWGESNMFPQEILQHNSRSPVNGAILDSKVTYICGKGVRDTKRDGASYVGEPHTGGTWDNVIKRLAIDYTTFGGFCFQVIVNKGSTTVSLYHQDFSTVRLGDLDEYGNPEAYYIANDWKKTSGKTAPVRLEKWQGMESAQKGTPYLYYFFDYQPGLRYYPVPSYYRALEYIKADVQLAAFYNNSIGNGFTPSVVISMPNNPSQAEKDAFQKAMEDKFTGPQGASRVVTVWGENKSVKPEITPFSASANADVYNNVEGIVFQKIISAHRLSSPTLAGVSGSGNLSGNASEIIDAFILFNYTVIDEMRRTLLDNLNAFTLINGLGALAIDELEVVQKIRESKNEDKILTIQDGSTPKDTESLAAKLGVGGTQALTTIMESATLPEAQKRGLLSILFGLVDEEIDRLFKQKQTK